MQLDLSVLQNIHSDFSSAGVGSTPGSRVADRKQNPLNTAADKNDFRSTLERAGGHREAVSQETNKGDASSGQTEAWSQARVDGKNVRQTKNESASVDGRTHHVQEAENKKISEEGDVIPLVPNGTDAVAAAIDDGVGAKVINFDLPIEEPSEISPTAQRKDGTMEPLLVAAKPEAPVAGAVTSGAVESVVFDRENFPSAAASIGPIKEEPEGLISAKNGRVSQTTPDLTSGVEASEADYDHPENEMSGKSSSAGQKISPKFDNSSSVSENAQVIAAGKTLAQEQTGSKPQSPESAKNAEKIQTVPQKPTVDEEPHRKANMSETISKADTERIARLSVDNEPGSRSQQTSAAQNNTRGGQDSSSASASNTSLDFDQNVKINDLASSSQRPVVGDGNSPVSAENLDSRPGTPKADVLNQIVDRAVFKLSNGQSEVRIDLKPDFLGPVRLQIVTESHQVSLRILTESPAVKEIIEGSLGQLKNDLQTQGLKVDEIDVSVAKDFNGYGRRSNTAAHGEHGRRGSAFKDQDLPDNERPDSHRISARLDSRAGGIDYFA